MTARRSARHRRRLRRLLLAGFVGLLGGGVWLGIWFDGTLHRIPALTDYPGRPPAGLDVTGTTWLLAGSDSRQNLTAEQQQRLATGGDVGGGRTDTLLLIHLPGFGSNAPTTFPTVVSIPRDSYLPIPGYRSDKVNAAYALGGAPLLTRTIEQATGLRLDHYAEIGFDGLATLVDALGGVTLCLPEPVADPLAGLDLPAGCRSLDGRAALGYARTRATPRADLDRMDHQRLLLSALLRRATSPAVWLNPWRWYAVPRAIAGAVTVDRETRGWDLARLGWELRGPVATLTVPIGEFTDSPPDGAGSVVIWDDDAASRLFQSLGRTAPPR